MNILVVLLILVQAAATEKDISLEERFAEAARSGQFPWQAFIESAYRRENTLCGGSLITTRWVLTAAHCVLGAYVYTVFLGTLKTKFPYENEMVSIVTTRVLIHENDNFQMMNDLALIDLRRDVKLSAYIKTIPLGVKFVGSNVSVTVSGWGKTSDYNDLSPTLNFVNLTTISNRKCKVHHPLILKSVLCAVGAAKRNFCIGDSGSPLVEYDENGNAVLVGIASFTSQYGCSSGIPSGYIRISTFSKWILSSIKE